jgi:cytochrome c biogenesis protein CcmG/thiol:disulfide interchange protein DsbE
MSDADRSDAEAPGSARPRRDAVWLWAGIAGTVVAAAAAAVILGSGGGSTGHTAPGRVEVARAVTVRGAALPPLPDHGHDPAVGRPAPTLAGVTFTGAPLTVAGAGPAHVVVFLAHWCPHCQAEVPRIVALARAGQIAVPVVGVATGTDANAPNYPPSAWLARESWPYPVLVDSGRDAAATAYGLPGYPFLVFVDAGGRVAGRVSGEVAPADLARIVAALAAGRPLPIPGTPGASSAA